MRSFKNMIKSTFTGEYLISVLHCIECKIVPVLIDDERAVKSFYYKSTGKQLDLDNPQTFSEKMNWYKLHGKTTLMQQCADKVNVREYIKSKGYGECLNEIYGVYSKVKDIDINSLPNQFVLKAAHGSHMNVIVRDKNAIDWRKEKMMMKTWLHRDIAWSGREWVYKNLQKRIIAERYIQDSTGELRDYKFFCFNGKPFYMQVDTGRFSGTHYRNYYDMDMNLIPMSDDCPRNDEIKYPIDVISFNTMKGIAEDLSQPFQHVRVDFYCVNKKIYIGEMTFFHNGGITWFKPDKYDLKFGNHWTLIP